MVGDGMCTAHQVHLFGKSEDSPAFIAVVRIGMYDSIIRKAEETLKISLFTPADQTIDIDVQTAFVNGIRYMSRGFAIKLGGNERVSLPQPGFYEIAGTKFNPIFVPTEEDESSDRPL